MSSTLETNPRLPPELEKLIFEIAAFIHPAAMPRILRVAHRIQIWIEPLLYNVLAIIADDAPSPTTKTRFIRRVRNINKLLRQREASFLRDHVRSVCLFADDPDDYFFCNYPKDFLPRLLSVCDTIVNLSFRGRGYLVPHLGSLPLQRLSVNISYLYHNTPPTFTQPFFLHVTHFDLYDLSWGDTWPDLASLAHLTHLSFRHNMIQDSLWQGALTYCPLLEVLVLLSNGRYRTAPPPSSDPRVVALRLVDYHADWELGARGGQDYWIRAEALVKERRAEMA
ncbi:hypothetical protein B0H19DRAFT_1160665 [Mycena capillaripes]|nr:hypothetical protein B0H19DRAFT_1160665 [Mycena capillaripes]